MVFIFKETKIKYPYSPQSDSSAPERSVTTMLIVTIIRISSGLLRGEWGCDAATPEAVKGRQEVFRVV